MDQERLGHQAQRHLAADRRRQVRMCCQSRRSCPATGVRARVRFAATLPSVSERYEVLRHPGAGDAEARERPGPAPDGNAALLAQPVA